MNEEKSKIGKSDNVNVEKSNKVQLKLKKSKTVKM